MMILGSHIQIKECIFSRDCREELRTGVDIGSNTLPITGKVGKEKEEGKGSMTLKFTTEVHGIPLIKHYVSHQMRSNIDEKVFTVLGDFMLPLATYELFNQNLNDSQRSKYILISYFPLCCINLRCNIFTDCTHKHLRKNFICNKMNEKKKSDIYNHI